MKRTLNREEFELWQKVVKDAQPMSTKAHEKQPLFVETHKLTPSSNNTQKRSKKPKPLPNIEPRFESRLQLRMRAPAPKMDARAYSKMKRANSSQKLSSIYTVSMVAQAHGATHNFINSSFGAGLRFGIDRDGKRVPETLDHWMEQGRGVLRQQVPQWLRQAHLQKQVLQVEEAHIRHGGSGALYVYLKKHKR